MRLTCFGARQGGEWAFGVTTPERREQLQSPHSPLPTRQYYSGCGAGRCSALLSPSRISDAPSPRS